MKGVLFDPLRLSTEVSALVERDGGRRVSRIGVAGAAGGSLTVYVAGCNLRCVHCWADESREDPLRHGGLLSPRDVAEKVKRFLREDRILGSSAIIRLSGGEPLLSEQSVGFIRQMMGFTGRKLLIETNGICLGACGAVAGELAEIRPDPPHVRLSLKAAWPETFERITGAGREACDLPFHAIERMLSAGLPFDLESVSLAPELMAEEERQDLRGRLKAMGEGILSRLREETLTPYPKTIERMAKAGRAISRGAGPDPDVEPQRPPAALPWATM